MARIPRRLRKLNLTIEDEEQLDEDELQGPPPIDKILPGRPHESSSNVKIVWPNGKIQQAVGEFRVKRLSDLKGGKVMVETDENGVPNERSEPILAGYIGDLVENPTFAPLHIPRWDNVLFDPKKMKIIRDVEEKFVYPVQTKQLTRDWVLGTANKRWRLHKHRLKQKYFKPNDKSLDDILKEVPAGVNEHQWPSIVGTWCQDSHRRLSQKNSYCGKQQKNSHTTGRKSHARLFKEMKIKKNGKVSNIELWDEAHKRKAENCTDEDVNTKKVQLRGFYSDKFWRNEKVSQGLTFIDEPEPQGNYQFELRAIGDNVEDLKDELHMMRAFIAKKFPGEDYRTAQFTTEYEVHNEKVDANDIQDGTNHNPEVSSDKEHTPSDTMQFQKFVSDNCTTTREGHVNLPLPRERFIAKKAHTENSAKSSQLGASRENVTVQELRSDNCSRVNKTCANSSVGHQQLIAEKVATENSAKSSQLGAARENVTVQELRSDNRTRVNKTCANSSVGQEQVIAKKVATENSGHVSAQSALQCQKGKFVVALLSTNPRNINKVVAKASLVSADKTYVVGGNMLGQEYLAVYVSGVAKDGDERLLRGCENIQTVRDAVGTVVAWPKSLVKRPKQPTDSQGTKPTG